MLLVPEIKLGDVVIRPVHRRMRIKDREVSLTEKESDIINVLALHRIATRKMICNAMYGTSGFWPKSLHHVDPHICRLRSKLEGSQLRIDPVRKEGYKLVVA